LILLKSFGLKGKTKNKTMENLIFAPALKSPAVQFNIHVELLISGKSIPEDSNQYYKPLFV